MGAKTVYVVTVNLDRAGDTIECLESVLHSDYEDVRIVVVDNGSTDDSVEAITRWASGATPYAAPRGPLAGLSLPPVTKPLPFARRSRADVDANRDHTLPRVTLITNPVNSGFAVGNNIALRAVLASAGDGYALLINNDMVLDPRAISVLVRDLERDANVAAIGGIVLDYAQPELVQMVGGARTTGLGLVDVLGAGLRRGEVTAGEELGFVGGGFLLIRLDTLREVGLLDEAFFVYGEDYDWGARMRKTGRRLTYSVDAFVWHKGSLTVAPRSPFQDYHQLRGMLRFVRKHRPYLMPLALGYSAYRCLAPKLLRREWTRARAVMRAYGDHLRSTAR